MLVRVYEMIALLKKNDIRMGIGLCNMKGSSTIMGCSG